MLPREKESWGASRCTKSGWSLRYLRDEIAVTADD